MGGCNTRKPLARVFMGTIFRLHIFIYFFLGLKTVNSRTEKKGLNEDLEIIRIIFYQQCSVFCENATRIW